LISKDGINTLSVNYFNDQYQKIYRSVISGNYIGSDISNNANMLYLSTNTPDMVRAVDCKNGEIVWIKEPQLPYPEFNSILVNNNLVYLSTDIGRIIGLTIDNGIQVFNTPVLPDSAPTNICITDDYLIADTRLRNSGATIWTTYYKQTGSKYQLFPTDYETTTIYDLEDNNRVIAFCNNNLTGQIINFNIKNNTIENRLVTTNIEIQKSCKIDETNFLFSSGNELFHFDQKNQLYVKILDTDDIIYDIKFDYINSQLFIIYLYKAEIVSYPGLAIIETIETLMQIKKAELLYGY
jgi:outer membrane protein assembly factor BamB